MYSVRYLGSSGNLPELISTISTFPAQLQLTKLEHTSAGQDVDRFTKIPPSLPVVIWPVNEEKYSMMH